MNRRSSLPLVTIGVPVYNEAEFIRESLESFLAQTYPHIEISIADNASTDGTSEICAEYAAKYPHITHIRHEKNIGQHANFNYLPLAAHGTYFCWASGHDLMENVFIEKSVNVLESDPKIVLAYPRTMYMAKDGRHLREESRPFDITKMSAARRFSEVMWRVDCNYVYGVWRLKPMRASKLFQLVPGLDRVFLAEMAVQGTFARADTFKYCRFNRVHKQNELEKRHRIMAYLYPGRTFTDAEISGNDHYVPTQQAFHQIVTDAHFPLLTRLRLRFSIWLSGVMKYHLFPGADTLSVIVKKLLPKRLLTMILRKMQ